MTDLEILEKIKSLCLELHKDKHAADFDRDEYDLALDSAILIAERLHNFKVAYWEGGTVNLHDRPELEIEVIDRAKTKKKITYSFKTPSDNGVRLVKALAAKLKLEIPDGVTRELAGLIAALDEAQPSESLGQEAWLKAALKRIAEDGLLAFPLIEEIYINGFSHGR